MPWYDVIPWWATLFMVLGGVATFIFLIGCMVKLLDLVCEVNATGRRVVEHEIILRSFDGSGLICRVAALEAKLRAATDASEPSEGPKGAD